MGDLELLQQYAREGSEEAFAELVGRHIGWVYLAALRQVRRPELADDVAQAVFIALAQQAGKLVRVGRPLAPWMFRVMRYAALMALRGGGKAEAARAGSGGDER